MTFFQILQRQQFLNPDSNITASTLGWKMSIRTTTEKQFKCWDSLYHVAEETRFL